MIRHYITIALRHLWKYKVQNLIGIIGLTVGLLCFSVCFYGYRFVETTDECFPEHERIAMMYLDDGRGWTTPLSSSDLAETLRGMSLSTAETFCTVTENRGNSRSYETEVEPGKVLPYELNTLEADTFFQKIFKPEFCAGTWETTRHTLNAILLSESASRRIFGKEMNPVGKTMRLSRKLSSSPEATPPEGGIIYTICGVVKDLPLNNSLSFLQPIDLWVFNDTEGWIRSDMKEFVSSSGTYALLREGSTAEDLQRELKTQKVKYHSFEQERTILATPLHTLQKRNASSLQWTLFCMGVLVVCAGLLNFFYFLIGSFRNRMHEYALRKVVGGSSLQLCALLGVQIFLVWGVVLLLMRIGMELVSPYLRIAIGEYWLSLDANVWSGQLWEYGGVLAVLCAVVCVCTVFSLQRKTRSKGLSGIVQKRDTHYLRNIMLGVQFFICWGFVACTAGLFLQSQKTSKTLFSTLSPLEKEAIFHVDLSYAFLTPADREALMDRIARHSGVQVISGSLWDFAQYSSAQTQLQEVREGEPDGKSLHVFFFPVDSCFFELMNLPLLSGRKMGRGEMVADQQFAEKNAALLGRAYDQYHKRFRLSGLTENFINSVDLYYAQLAGVVFLPIERPETIMHYYIKATPGREEEVKRFIEKELHELLPETVEPRLSTFAEDLHTWHFMENKLKNGVLFVAIVSLLIALLGVYSAVTLDTVRRQKEVSIRKVHGAKARHILFLFVRLYALLLTISALCAFPLVYHLFKRWLATYTVTFNYGPWFWIILFVSLSAVTGLTVLFKILHIARTNPAKTLKNE